MDIAAIRRHIVQLITDIESNANPVLEQLIRESYFNCHWFTVNEIRRRLRAMVQYIMSSEFDKHYGHFPAISHPCNIAFYAEEHIPLEEFFSVCTLLALGHRVQYRGSSHPDRVFRWIMEYLQQQGLFKGKIIFVDEQFQEFDKLILATRNPWPEKNRRLLQQKHKVLELIRYQSVAIVPSTVTDGQLNQLVTDVFCYFGMGCGNVRKIFVPHNFNFDRLFQAAELWYEPMFNHHAYMNNYQYYQSIYLMNRIIHRDNGFIILKEDAQHHAPTGVLFYEFYDDEQLLRQQLHRTSDIHGVYTTAPSLPEEIAYGESVNQLFLPQKEIIDFAIEA